MIELVFPVFREGEGEDVGRHIDIPVFLVELLDLVVVHKRHAHFKHIVQPLEGEDSGAAAADQQAEPRWDFDFGLLVADQNF